ncbi:hypothetical protein BCR34DRAFT_608506 [Clohesyomyces aquaticus]|uniref:Uncharacterized protein n=1 Tax=Clohesyomyces aquaticus TaxID=1231657 RepID=A0A1Y1Y7T6_9PLEO|nr:hypothetical protein BCR34DRAFT_608506 [Clohesyomyces aquaticus]
MLIQADANSLHIIPNGVAADQHIVVKVEDRVSHRHQGLSGIDLDKGSTKENLIVLLNHEEDSRARSEDTIETEVAPGEDLDDQANAEANDYLDSDEDTEINTNKEIDANADANSDNEIDANGDNETDADSDNETDADGDNETNANGDNETNANGDDMTDANGDDMTDADSNDETNASKVLVDLEPCRLVRKRCRGSMKCIMY